MTWFSLRMGAFGSTHTRLRMPRMLRLWRRRRIARPAMSTTVPESGTNGWVVRLPWVTSTIRLWVSIGGMRRLTAPGQGSTDGGGVAAGVQWPRSLSLPGGRSADRSRACEFRSYRQVTIPNHRGREPTEGASPYGAMDMDGNVWEWTANKGLLRGAAWNNTDGLTRCSGRYRAMPASRDHALGFRCVRRKR